MLDTKSTTKPTLRTSDWYKSATRWTQLTLAEDDPIRFDPEQWIDIFRRTQSNAVCLSAGGYVAYYPSKVPLHYVSKYIENTDPFGRLVEGARALDMHVMARVDPHAIHQDAADAHPEWIAVDKDGNPRRHWAYPDVWVTCAYGDYNNVFMLDVVKEITRDYDIDAVFANRWQGHGICYCDSCRSRFGAETGHELPTTTEVDDPAWQAWQGWRRKVLTNMVISWDEAVKAIKPHASFIPNMGGASLMEFDLALIEKHCPFLVVDHQGRRGLEPVWMSGRNAKRMRATFPERPTILITSVGPEEEHRWKDSVTTGPEIQSWMMNGAAHGMLPWFTKFNGVVPDERWIAPVADAFAVHADLEPVLAPMTATAEIALIEPSTTLKQFSPEERRVIEADDLGFYHALVEAGLPFEMISDEAMTVEKLNRFKVVVLPNAVCLSDAQCAVLSDYVAAGGSLIAASETATRTPDGKRRTEIGLADALGVTLRAHARGPVKNTYVELTDAHPVNAGYEGARRIIGGTRLLDVAATGQAETPFLFVPDFPDLPMEEVYPREAAHAPAVILSENAAGGRTAYVPWNLGATFWQVLAADHGRLIDNLVRWTLRDEPAISVEGPGVMDVAARTGDNGMAVVLFNLTNPMMMKGPIRSVEPSAPQTVNVRLPDGIAGVNARLLVSGEKADAERVGAVLRVRVPSVELLEVVHLTWA
ncbi:family 10 glycosylhydrolase [Pelagibacterium xiamenense]|uniref:family 10 glycosylhydrolase n=1 Tax=Pelagibacterium xiamenense TaxID=2901140 RepID=UPI001E61E4DD|nr:alpha-amylase family protein [Pelagibacterium xiamenense]MCD7060639.1 family 10 glycosylhydrolase [Pelagibacterium xiamenense]